MHVDERHARIRQIDPEVVGCLDTYLRADDVQPYSKQHDCEEILAVTHLANLSDFGIDLIPQEEAQRGGGYTAELRRISEASQTCEREAGMSQAEAARRLGKASVVRLRVRIGERRVNVVRLRAFREAVSGVDGVVLLAFAGPHVSAQRRPYQPGYTGGEEVTSLGPRELRVVTGLELRECEESRMLDFIDLPIAQERHSCDLSLTGVLHRVLDMYQGAPLTAKHPQ
jgi:hypothetical protein